MKENNLKYLLLPAISWVLVFTVFPLIYSLRISFFSWRLTGQTQFTGLANYLRLFGDERLLHALKLTIVYAFITVGIQFLLGMGLALLLYIEIKGRQYIRAVLILPLFVTPVALGYSMITVFQEEGGAINTITRILGIKVPWLSDPVMSIISVALVDIWQWTPFCFIILLAGLLSLPDEPYEAALLDGASRIQLFRYITFPLLIPIISIMMFLRLAESFKIFDIPYALTGGGPGTATEFYTMYTYKTGLKYFDMGYASAQAYLLLAIVLMVLTAFFKIMRDLYE